jgi:hypothetical protein
MRRMIAEAAYAGAIAAIRNAAGGVQQARLGA